MKIKAGPPSPSEHPQEGVDEGPWVQRSKGGGYSSRDETGNKKMDEFLPQRKLFISMVTWRWSPPYLDRSWVTAGGLVATGSAPFLLVKVVEPALMKDQEREARWTEGAWQTSQLQVPGMAPPLQQPQWIHLRGRGWERTVALPPATPLSHSQVSLGATNMSSESPLGGRIKASTPPPCPPSGDPLL